jgi:N-acetylmuramoyl-L-alanine amidase
VRSASTRAAAAARPDAALYAEARRGENALRASRKRAAQAAEWEKVVLRFRRLVARYPQSGYADDALMAVGESYREMARRFKDARYREDAIRAYRGVVSEYPRSRHGEPALYHCFTLARRGEAAQAARAYLEAFPQGAHAKEVRGQLRRREPAQAAALPSPPPPGLSRVFNVRTWTGEAYTRVAIDLERKVRIEQDRIQDPDRIWIDLQGSRLHRNLTDRTFPVGDGLLKQIRIAQNRDDVVRVVLDLGKVKDHSAFYLENPLRLIVDIRGTPRPRIASARPPTDADAEPPAWDGPGDPPVVGTAPAAPPVSRAAAAPSPAPPASTAGVPPALADKGWVKPLPTRRLPAIVADAPPVAPARTPPVLEGNVPPLPAGAPAPPAPAPAAPALTRAEPGAPQANRAGSYSLARQLGLGARTIVLDAGHGGHDPGSIGPGGLQEKELVLDVTLRLERLLRARLGAEVILTRPHDAFVALEERTAIANSRGADLFLSIHANSSRTPRSRGIETYFLSFAKGRHAEAVAARENAISPATMKDLQNLVKAIATNSKIDESRDFASSVQEAMVRGLRPHVPDVLDRGVHTAPFYVLIGANMPSVLAEISFVSNPAEEKLLKKGAHRDRIAESLFAGVKAYLETLNRGPFRQTTSASPRRR